MGLRMMAQYSTALFLWFIAFIKVCYEDKHQISVAGKLKAVKEV